jgi:AraC-like DNA-binding protein
MPKPKIGKTRHEPETTLDEIYDPGMTGKKGILRWPPAAGKFQHLRRAPSPELQEWIDRYWMVSWDLEDEPCLQETLPYPVVHVTFEEGECRVGGVHSGRFSTVLKGRSRVFGIKFRPGGFRPFLLAPVATLRDRIIPGEKVFGKPIRQFVDLWESGCDVNEMITAVDAFLRERCPEADENAEVAAKLVLQMQEDREIHRVEDVVARTGMTKRSLQRIFREYVGISPKWVICRFRMHEAVEEVHSGERIDFAALAQELGYFDQAHFINEFRNIIGLSPTEYKKQVNRE